MGMFDWLTGLFRGTPEGTAAEVADRLDRFADRFENAGEILAARAARDAAADARRAPSGSAARRIEDEFLRSRGLRPDGRPMSPTFGRDPGGNEYVRVGATVRAGGSRGWRYNNPGYVRCSPRSSSYGAIGCDGEYAVFPDHATGSRALWSSLRDEYPNDTLRDALQKHLPPEAMCDPDRFCDEAGVDPAVQAGILTNPPVVAPPGGVSGNTYDRDAGDCPDWVEAAWDSPGEREGGGDTTAPTDNS